MRLQPKSEKEIQEARFPVLPTGKYNFEVLEATEEVSKKGNAMIVLKLKIFDDGFNALAYLKDYLMESMAYKLRHAAYTCGLGINYDAGELEAAGFVGKTGLLELGIQKDKTGQYPDRNSVQDYIKEEQGASAAKSVPNKEWDDIPF